MDNIETKAKQLDLEDPLVAYRDKFLFPTADEGEETIYLCGNSLGLQPKTAKRSVENVLDDWSKYGVEGHFEGTRPWMHYHEKLSRQMAKLVGAKAIEVTLMNTLTVNLHLMMVSFYRPTPTRYKILIESDIFPSDRYALKAQLQWHGFDDGLVELKPKPGEVLLRNDDILEYISEHGQEIALILLGCPNYYTGQVYAMDKITSIAHQQGCQIGFDLAHGVGNIPLQLHDTGPDFAIWCTYKYLNSGPGSISGCFIHERHALDFSRQRLAGWWGQKHESRFEMPDTFDPIPGVEGWQISNIPILSMAPLTASLQLFDEIGMDALRMKSVKLTNFMEELINSIGDQRINIITPADPEERGCQLSIQVKHVGKALFDQIGDRGIILDWREPDVIRAAPVPLYNSFSDVARFIDVLEECLKTIN